MCNIQCPNAAQDPKTEDYGCDANWASSDGHDCDHYRNNDYCNEYWDHYGTEWESHKGKFAGWADARGRSALVCPKCGCGTGTTLSLLFFMEVCILFCMTI